MIEVVLGSGAEVIAYKCPAAERDSDAEVVLLVVLAAQGQEAKPLLSGEFQQRPGNGLQWWRLIVTPPRGAEYQPSFRMRRAAPTRGVPQPINSARKVRQPRTASESKPRECADMIFRVDDLHLSQLNLALRQRLPCHRMGPAEELIVIRGIALISNPCVMASANHEKLPLGQHRSIHDRSPG